jgi:hypothetical protein
VLDPLFSPALRRPTQHRHAQVLPPAPLLRALVPPVPSFFHLAPWTRPLLPIPLPTSVSKSVAPHQILFSAWLWRHQGAPPLPSHFLVAYCPTPSTGSPSHRRNGTGPLPLHRTSVRSTSSAFILLAPNGLPPHVLTHLLKQQELPWLAASHCEALTIVECHQFFPESPPHHRETDSVRPPPLALPGALLFSSCSRHRSRRPSATSEPSPLAPPQPCGTRWPCRRCARRVAQLGHIGQLYPMGRANSIAFRLPGTIGHYVMALWPWALRGRYCSPISIPEFLSQFKL